MMVSKSDPDTKAELAPVDSEAVPYLQTLLGAGEHGFAPTSHRYKSIMQALCAKGFAQFDGFHTYRLSAGGKAELEKHKRNEATRLATAEARSAGG